MATTRQRRAAVRAGDGGGGGALDEQSLIRAAPVLARLALAAWWRATGWTIEVSARVSVRLVRSAAAGEPPAEMLRAAELELREYLRQLLGLEDSADGDRGSGGAPDHDYEATGVEMEPVDMPNGQLTAADLRAIGAELLRRSADLEYDVDAHPAYARILHELAPDEARILRLLALEGPQPSVDVRTGGPLGMVKSELVAPGLNMIAAQAGCRHPEGGHAYLDNLSRLGLVWFSREQLDDLPRYQVLEAQPEVAKALEDAGRGGRTIRRSIHLTRFGIDFCRMCLPLDTDEIDALPGG